MAGLLGPTLIAIGITEATNLPVLPDPPDPVGLVYLNGTLLFVAGLAIVRVHNRWRGGWPVLVTIMGWFAILVDCFGCLLRALPRRVQQRSTAC